AMAKLLPPPLHVPKWQEDGNAAFSLAARFALIPLQKRQMQVDKAPPKAAWPTHEKYGSLSVFKIRFKESIFFSCAGFRLPASFLTSLGFLARTTNQLRSIQ
ncbi:unnamed protein product, partial [Effrenium voratum]